MTTVATNLMIDLAATNGCFKTNKERAYIYISKVLKTSLLHVYERIEKAMSIDVIMVDYLVDKY